MGQIAASAVRYVIEDHLASAFEDGDATHVEMISYTRIDLVVTTEREVGGREAELLVDALRDAVGGCLEPGRALVVAPFEARVVSPTP